MNGIKRIRDNNNKIERLFKTNQTLICGKKLVEKRGFV
jgi:hypothetical protein